MESKNKLTKQMLSSVRFGFWKISISLIAVLNIHNLFIDVKCNFTRKNSKVFNDRLAKVLKAKNISQVRLAEAVGCSRQNISDWLAGKTSPKFDKLVKLACFLNVTLEELLEDEAKMLGLNLPEYRKTDINSDEQELLNIFGSLNTLDRVRLLTFAYELSGAAINTPFTSSRYSNMKVKTSWDNAYILKPEEEKTKS